MEWNIGIGKNEFSRRLAENANITYKDSKVIVDAFMETLTQYMVEEQKVTFKGFGYFETVNKKSRKGVNIKGKDIMIDGFKAVKFKQTADMKALLNSRKNKNNDK